SPLAPVPHMADPVRRLPPGSHRRLGPRIILACLHGDNHDLPGGLSLAAGIPGVGGGALELPERAAGRPLGTLELRAVDGSTSHPRTASDAFGPANRTSGDDVVSP